MKQFFIGLISGTSIDAIDSVLVDFHDTKPILIGYYNHPIPDKIYSQLNQVCLENTLSLDTLGELDTMMGELFADTALKLLEKSGENVSNILAIGSHGQTIRHKPNKPHPFSLQIGDPNIIAARTNITTIADFRRKDIALNGHGAPLTPAFHQTCFSDRKTNRVILNIGGIANVTLLQPNQDIIGFDTGPGNTLLDEWIRLYKQEHFDNKGKWAETGSINHSLLSCLTKDPFFSFAPPKSTGREYFNLAWLNRYLEEINPTPTAQDIQATLTELTAITIIQSIEDSLKEPYELFVCGGGIHNDYLMKRLETHCKYNIYSTTHLGLDPDWVEAIAFAWLAKQTLTHQPINLKNITGANKPSVLGGIYYV